MNDTKRFVLKERDTLPVLEVVLRNPDGTVHDLTGATGFKLHVRLPSGAVLSRTMTKVGPDTDGRLRYAWAATDWDAGGLVAGALPMEYEVTGAGGARLTFPNGRDEGGLVDAYHVLSISPDIGQG